MGASLMSSHRLRILADQTVLQLHAPVSDWVPIAKL